MTCSLPDLLWARISYANGKWSVLESDGKKTAFMTEEAAISYLREDEYERYDDLDVEDIERLGRPVSSLTPPDAVNDRELLRKMREDVT